MVRIDEKVAVPDIGVHPRQRDRREAVTRADVEDGCVLGEIEQL